MTSFPRISLPVRVKEQEEGHTCGACALYALTRYHDLDYTFSDIRAMLGTDHSLVMFPGRSKIETLLEDTLEDWLGTLPVDIFYTLWMLGFTSRNLPLGKKAFRPALQTQLQASNPVIGLVNSPWGPHWVLLTGITRTGISLTDSLNPYRKVFWRQEKANKMLLGAIAALPREDLLLPAMARSVPFHITLAARYGHLQMKTLNGRGQAA